MDTWALVLAAGEGSRLRSLTRNEQGVVLPKQFCSLQGGPCLLQEALQRAASIAPLQRICSVVAEQHRQWWTPLLSYLPEQNVISQPQNRGTAFGILLPLLRIIERDPDATVVLLPADHYLSAEKIMAASVRTLLSLFDGRFATTIAALRGFGGADLDSVYQNLRSMDFSKDVLQGRESILRVIGVAHCGWTDLGTPERVGRILEGLPSSANPPYLPAHVSLADQFMRSGV